MYNITLFNTNVWIINWWPEKKFKFKYTRFSKHATYYGVLFYFSILFMFIEIRVSRIEK